MKDNSVIFIPTTSPKLYDRMDADYLHPERVNIIEKLQKLEDDGTITLKRLIELVTVSKPHTDTSGDEILTCIEMEDVDVDYALVNLKRTRVKDAGTSTVEFKEGEILFSGIRPYLNKVVLAPNCVKKGICSGEFYILSSRNRKENMGYLWLVLRSEFVLNQSKHLPSGSLRPRVEDSDISDLTIPVLNDTKLVSEIDYCTKNTLEQYYPALQKLQSTPLNFPDSIRLDPAPTISPLYFGYAKQQPDGPRPFYRMDPLFYHPLYYSKLKELLENWAKLHNGRVERFKDLCINDGIGRWKAKVTGEGSIPRLGVENITGIGILWDCKFVEVIDKHNKAVIQKNDILISSTGIGSAGRVDLFNEDWPAITDGHITIARLKPGVDPYYILAFLRCEYATRQMSRMERGTSGQLEMYPEDIGQLLIPIPNIDTIISNSRKKIKEASNEIQAAKQNLYYIRSRLTAYILNMSIAKLGYISNTTIPRPGWRIIRP